MDSRLGRPVMDSGPSMDGLGNPWLARAIRGWPEFTIGPEQLRFFGMAEAFRWPYLSFSSPSPSLIYQPRISAQGPADG
jgi:hypothetical protein